MASKAIMKSDPDRADHRMISFIMRTHYRHKGKPSDKVYQKIANVFQKAGGSWMKLFQGSTEDFDLLKKTIKVAIKKGILPKKKKE